MKREATLDRYFRLRDVLDEFSRSLNVHDLPDRDIRVFRSVFVVTRQGDQKVSAQDILGHKYCADLSPATVYRALTSLCERDAISCSKSHPKFYWVDL